MRPLVYSNLAVTADGKITSAARETPRFTSAADRRRMDALRAEADVIVIGAATLRGDDPPMHVRDPAMQARRRASGRPPGLDYAVVTESLTVAPTARFFAAPEGGRRLVVTTVGAGADAAGQATLTALTALPQVAVWRLGEAAVDVAALVARLAAAGARRILVEGGGELMWHFVAADLVDEFHLTVAPALLGGRDAPTWLGGPGLTMPAQRRLQLLAAEVEGDEIFCHWRLRRAAPGPDGDGDGA